MKCSLRDIDEMPVDEFRHWMILEQVEPFGERGEYLRAAIIAATIANCNRGKDTQPFKAIDFIPDFDNQRNREQSDDEIFATIDALGRQQDALLRARGDLPPLESDPFAEPDIEDI